MKIVHVNRSDKNGGAAIAAYRLHKALLEAGVESLMLVDDKCSDDDSVIGPNSKAKRFYSMVKPSIDQLLLKFYPRKTKTLYSSAWLPTDFSKRINALNPDIVHLHWIGGGMTSIRGISKIKAPVVWSLHDMWAFTGGEHYDEEQKHYMEQCGCSRVLGSGFKYDLSYWQWKAKKRAYAKIKQLIPLGLSSWMYDSSRKSSLFRDRKNRCLPNLIDSDVYKPISKNLARSAFNLPENKKLILFGAMNATSDPRKGFDYLNQALESLDKEYELVIFGASRASGSSNFRQKTHYMGKLNDDVSLMLLYNCADVMVVPSIQENLSNAIIESLSCGTPVVGFDIGGNTDMIEHKVNGYLASPFEASDLAKGIDWVLSQDASIKTMARQKVLNLFDRPKVVPRYIELYEKLVKGEE